jgi:xylulose-5-phosphate/fructose-6-phosphate phosphoketolase
MHLRQMIRDRLVEHQGYITEHGEDMPIVREWRWPHDAGAKVP